MLAFDYAIHSSTADCLFNLAPSSPWEKIKEALRAATDPDERSRLIKEGANLIEDKYDKPPKVEPFSFEKLIDTDKIAKLFEEKIKQEVDNFVNSDILKNPLVE